MASTIRFDPRHGGQSGSVGRSRAGATHPDWVLADLAAAQHGVVSRRQLLASGVSGRIIEGRIARGILLPLHRGVYAVGHRPASSNGWWLAAVLACGTGAVLGGRSAAALWVLRASDGHRPEVTAAHTLVRAGVASRRIDLPAEERTVHDAIPVTTPMRTLVDLAGRLDRAALAKAINEAEVQRRFDGRELDRLLRRHPRARGTGRLRAILADLDVGSGRTESELERRFLPFLDAHELPHPLINEEIRLPGFAPKVDCQWAGRHLAVELDGRATHHTRAAFESDRTRDRRLTAAGWRVVRITWRELDVRPGEVAAHLRALLEAES